jgi:hypothetical protein
MRDFVAVIGNDSALGRKAQEPRPGLTNMVIYADLRLPEATLAWEMMVQLKCISMRSDMK